MTVDFLTVADRGVAYQRQIGDPKKPGILFLAGYASDMTGTKAAYLAQRCAKESLGFMRFDYSGCGQSLGTFTEGTIGKWLGDSLAVLDQLTKGPQIVIGSSMGGWLGLLLAQKRPERIKAFIGIAAAPDFTENLVWVTLTETQRAALLRDGEIYDDNAPPDHRVPMTLRLIEEAREHLLLHKPFSLSCPVRLLQGTDDKEVPHDYAQRLADCLKNTDVRINLIKNGDHRLNTPENLAILWQTIAEFI